MKKNAIFLLTFLVCRFCYSQSGSTKSWTDMLSQATISLGKDSIVDFRESSGSIVKKRIFNIVGTGVSFYIKAIRGKDTIPAATVVTARHVFYSPQENHIPTIF